MKLRKEDKGSPILRTNRHDGKSRVVKKKKTRLGRSKKVRGRRSRGK